MSETINDPYLGIIKYDHDRDEYTGKITNNDDKIIEFSFDINNNFQEVLKGVHQIIENYCDRTLEFRLYAAEKLLDLYNDTWSKDEVIDKNEFINRIAVESIVIHNDCNAELYYLDSDLFAGHYIVINMDSEGQLKDAYLAG